MSWGAVSLVGICLIVTAILAFVLLVSRGPSNRWPAIGTNTGQRGAGMIWWKRRWPDPSDTAYPSVDEALGPHYDLLTLERQVERDEARRRNRQRRSRSWMEEPDAWDRPAPNAVPDRPAEPDGLVEAGGTGAAAHPPVAADPSREHHHRRHRWRRRRQG